MEYQQIIERLEYHIEKLYESRKKLYIGIAVLSVLMGGDIAFDGIHFNTKNEKQYVTMSTSQGEFLLNESNGHLYKYVPNGKIGSWVETPFITQEQEIDLEKKLKLEQGQEQASEPHAGESHPHTHEENATARVSQ